MNKQELAKAIAERTGLPRDKAGDAMNALTVIITEKLAGGGKIRLPGLGIFECRTRPARTGCNPRTREPMEIPERTIPAFKAGRALKTAVQG